MYYKIYFISINSFYIDKIWLKDPTTNGDNLKKFKVVSFPDHHDYCKIFKKELEKNGHHVKLHPSYHYSTPLNLLKLIYYHLKGYNIIHVHWIFFRHIIILKTFLYLSRNLNFKLYWEVHNVKKHRSNILKNEDLARKIFIKNVDGFIFHTEEHKKLFEKSYNVDVNNYIIYPHGNFIGYYENKVTKEKAREKLKIYGDNIVLLFGTIAEYRGYDEVFKFIIENKESKKYTFLIAGKLIDNKFKRYLNIVKKFENVHVYTGFIDNNDIQFYFNAADVCLLPYKEISTSGVGILSASFSLPIIAVNKGCISKYLVDEETGIVLENNDVQGIKKSLEHAFSMNLDELGKNLYKKIRKNNSWNYTIKQLEILYDK